MDREFEFGQFMEYIPVGIFIKDAKGRYLYVNRFHRDFYGRSDWEGKTASEMFPGDPEIGKIRGEDERVLAGETLRVFMDRLDRGGRERSFNLIKFPLGGVVSRGSAGRIGCIIEDITELERSRRALAAALTEKEVLLRELRHRVKNSLSTVSALVGLAAAGIADPAAAAAFADCRSRVDSMAVLHDELSGAGGKLAVDCASFLPGVARRLHGWHPAGGRVSLRVEAEALELSAQLAAPLGLAANELITNALKYAYPGGRRGVLELRLWTYEVPGGKRCALEVSDDGPGLPPGLDPATSGGLGLTLVRALAAQLDGELEFLPGQGARARLSFPLQAPSQAT